jgi:hypothetical protein
MGSTVMSPKYWKDYSWGAYPRFFISLNLEKYGWVAKPGVENLPQGRTPIEG